MTENELIRMERRHSTCNFTASAANGLYFATAPDDKRIVLFTAQGKRRNALILTKAQAEKLAEELPDMLCMIGRGKPWNSQGRWSQG